MESEYKAPIEISVNDPICAVNGIEGTVIGILFDKTGAEISKAIVSRLEVLEKEIKRYSVVTGVATEFLQKKRKEVEKLEKLYAKRSEEKLAQARPFERKMRDIQKSWNDKSFVFDKVTEKQIAGEAVGFEKGFDEFEGTFQKIDVLIEEQENANVTTRNLHALRSKGIISSSSSSSTSSTSGGSSSISDAVYTMSANQLCEKEDEEFESTLRINPTEDKALARLSNLKDLLVRYINKLKQLAGKVNDLKAEERRLNLIKRNLDPVRTYKLDLNKLSAFGFEDLKVSH